MDPDLQKRITEAMQNPRAVRRGHDFRQLDLRLNRLEQMLPRADPGEVVRLHPQQVLRFAQLPRERAVQRRSLTQLFFELLGEIAEFVDSVGQSALLLRHRRTCSW